MIRHPLSTRAALLAATVLLLCAAVTAQEARLAIQADQPGPRISPTLYGLFFEEINCAGDGGIYAEMVRNRSAEDSDQPDHWTLVSSGPAKVELSVNTEQPLSAGNPRFLKVKITEPGSGRVGVANAGYWGLSVIQGAGYRFSMSARGEEEFTGPLTVTLESGDGVIYAQARTARLSPDWKNYEFSLTSKSTDPKARLVISTTKTGTFALDLVSLFPKTWKGRSNGLRPDLAEMLAGLKPAFVRFPGGCWVEGDTMKLAYRWKQTIGNLGERRNQYNIWQYHSTHGLGYHEYLQMCEDLRAEPLFVVNCGMSHREVVPMDKMDEFVQDALDAIEYANGPAESKWGSQRVRNGHPAPFNLNYLEIGNENGGRAYHERYALMYKAIKERYPRMQLIADEWGGVPRDTPVEIVDEHYYNSPGFFIQHADRYDTYDRKGPKVYVGEYAVTQGSGQGNLRGALGEAAFMTGLERNADIVVMSSYAPLFANLNYKKWNPDLINFDSSRVYGTPSYYVQKLFAENRGEVVLPVQLEFARNTPAPVPAVRGAVGLGTWLTQAEYKEVKVTRDGQDLFVSDFARGTQGWRFRGGQWSAKEGALQQTGPGEDRRAMAGDASWTDYTLSLKARKLSGAEGFLVMFHVQDDQNWVWWNLGGWGNARHGIELCQEGAKSELGRSVAGRIETGRWYDIRVQLNGTKISCYLDDKLVQEATHTPVSSKPMFAVAGRAEAAGEIVVKVVNVSKEDQPTRIDLQGVKAVSPKAMAVVLTSADPLDENSIQDPTKVTPVTRTIENAAPSFRHTFPANSLTVLRFKTRP